MKRRPDGLIIAILFATLFVASVDNQLLIPLLPLLSGDLSVPVQQVGWLISIYALAAALFNLIIGPLTDRFGRVLFLRFGLLAFGLLSVLTYRVDGFGELLLLRTGAGFVGGLLSLCIFSFVGDWFPYARRGRVMGTILVAYFAALTLGIPMSAWIAQEYGWRSVFLVSGVAASGVFVPMLVFLPADIPSQKGAGVRARYLRDYVSFLGNRRLLGGLLTSFAVSGTTLSFLTYVSPYLNRRFGLTPIEISWIFILAGVAAVVASPLSGWLSDRWTKRSVFLVSNSLLVLPLLLLNQVLWGAALLLLFFVLSLAVAFRQTSLQTIQTELVPSSQRGAFLALRNSFSQLGISLCVLVSGRLYGGAGYGAVLFFAAALTLAASVLFYLWVHEPRALPAGSKAAPTRTASPTGEN